MRLRTIFLVAIFFFSPGCGGSGDSTAYDGPELLFVQSANEAYLRGDRLILEGLQEVAWFSDRPYREVGRATTADFIDVWQKGENSFAEDPPNADLVCSTGSEDVTALVELSDPVLDLAVDLLSYRVEAVAGSELPAELDCASGTAHLFIDALRGDEM
ncbi:hypothetical protein OAE84_00645 [bacterium]|nr:hypothetical protein [bacterium]